MTHLWYVCLLSALVGAGCTPSEDTQQEAAPQSEPQSWDEPVPAQTAPEAQVGDQRGPAWWLAEAQAAQQARDYERTTRLLLAIRAQPQALSREQAEAYTTQMRSFQRHLADAVAEGDPQAIAAAQELRASASH